MNALVTGGAGFIGSNLTELLLSEGIGVTVLDDLSSGFRRNLDAIPSARFLEGDVRDQAAVDEAASGADAIFHLAASVGNQRAIDDPIADAEINVIGTLRVLEAARKHGVRKVVISSSAGIFGELKQVPVGEDHPVEPISPYGASKLGAEKEALAYGALHGIEVAALRYFNVYGVRQRYDAYGNVIPIFAHHMVRGEQLTIFGDGDQTRDFVNVRDVARANLLACRAVGFHGPLNVASGTRVTINRLVALMSEVSGIEARVTHGDPRPGDVRDSLADISAASAAIGFVPEVGLEDGLREYMAWVKQEA